MRCYIAGRISGLPKEEARRNFGSAVLRVEAWGMEAVNPMCTLVPYCWPWLVHMVWDLCLLSRCEAVAFQDNWQESRGARIEMKVARMLGKEVFLLYEQ